MPEAVPSARTRVHRLPKRARYGRDDVYEVLDAARICHVGVVRDGAPVVIPTIHARDGDTVLLHGSPAAGLMRDARSPTALCVTVTLVDALVLARAVRNHSMNYRSAVVFGDGELVTDDDAKLRALRIITERLAPGRWDVTRPPTTRELRETAVVAVPIADASVKVRTGGPGETEADHAVAAWAGVLPLVTSWGEPQAAPGSPAAARPPAWAAGPAGS